MCLLLVSALPQLGLPYLFHTDASHHGLGAALFETHKMEEGEEQNSLVYSSRTLTEPERNYSATNGSFLLGYIHTSYQGVGLGIQSRSQRTSSPGGKPRFTNLGPSFA